MEESFKDTDLREALRRKYSDTPQLPADFMTKMQEQMAQHSESSMTKPVSKNRRWYWVAAAACLLTLIGVGVTMLQKDQINQTEETYAQTNHPKKTNPGSEQEGQQIGEIPTNEKQEELQHPKAVAKNNKPATSEIRISSETSPKSKTSPMPKASPMPETSPSPESPAIYRPAKDDNLHYASQSLTEDSTYQAPGRMDEFVAKIAAHNKVKAVPLDCALNKDDSTIVNTAYVFQDTKELDLFGRLLQAACWYDSKTPGYLLNFSHQQFFFTLKDLRKGQKYLWIAERVEGQRILLYSTHSPIDANVSSVCYQNFREQLTHIHF